MDIDKIKYIIDFSKKTGINYALEQEDIEILEHILAEREKDKKRIEELEDENRIQRHQIMQVFDRGYIHKDKIKDEYIPKQKVEEELEKAEKENEPYERHNKESRMYWINQGKISLAKKLLEDK